MDGWMHIMTDQYSRLTTDFTAHTIQIHTEHFPENIFVSILFFM